MVPHTPIWLVLMCLGVCFCCLKLALRLRATIALQCSTRRMFARRTLTRLRAEKKAEEATEGKEESGDKEKKEVKKDTSAKKEPKAKAVKSDKSSKGSSKPAPVKKITTPRKAS